MERPAKRQKVSQDTFTDPRPTRTLDLAGFQRQHIRRRRSQGNAILPRVPDVTVIAGILDIAINDEPVTTRIAVPTASIELSLGSLGTVVLPELTSTSTTIGKTTTAFNSTTTSFPTITASNGTNSTTEKTVTITETSTFRISYQNGTFIAPTATLTSLLSSDDIDSTVTDSDSSASTAYISGGSTDSYSSATATGGSYNGGALPGSTGSGLSPSSTGKATDDPSPPVLTQQQTQMVGGIVGGVAGIALVFIAMLYFLRWYRERMKRLGRIPKGIGPSGHDSKDYSGAGLVQSAAPIAQYSKHFMYPSTMGMKKLRPASDVTTVTTTTVESEKGFSRISGRKIAPVLTTGGDQYGGSYGVFEKEVDPSDRSSALSKHNDLSDGSFYRDTHGVYFGKGQTASRSEPTTPIYPSVFVENNTSRRPSLAETQGRDFAPHDFDNALRRNTANKADGLAVFRGSPARTPVTQSPTTNSLKLPIQAPVTMDSDIPEMPLPSPGLGHDLMRSRNFSRLSARSTSSGKFKEELK